MKYFKFTKEEDNKWYIVLPEWDGDKSDLEMVCGADTMLDIISQGELVVHLSIDTMPFNESRITLTISHEDGGGGWYNLSSGLYDFEFDVWLCKVTKFIYGYMPKKLYCSW